MRASLDQLTILLPIVVTSALMTKMYRDANRAPHETPDGAIVLRAGTVARFSGALGVVAGMGIPVLAFFSPPKDRGDLLAIVGMTLFFGLLGAWLLVKSLREEIVISDAGLLSRSMRGKLTSLRWTEITAVEFKAMQQEFHVRAGAHRRIAVGISLVGIKAFVAALERHLPRQIHADAVAKWARAAAGRA